MFEDLSPEELQRRATAPLTEPALATLRARGERRTVSKGETLYRAGDRGYPFIYVISAALEVRDPDGLVLSVMDAGQYTGEFGLLLGQIAFANCVCVQNGDVVVVDPAEIANLIQVDPELSDLLLSAFAARRLLLTARGQGTLTLIGKQDEPALRSLVEYAARNRIPYRQLSLEGAAHAEALPAEARRGAGVRVVVHGRQVLQSPSVAEVARALGLELALDPRDPVDLIIAGAGPAGLSTAVYGASEGLSTVLFDDTAIGGQAAASSRIENFLGFPTGVSGAELAFCAELQAVKFGACVAVPRRAQRLRRSDRPGLYEIVLDDGAVLCGRTVVIATGARYRTLGVADEVRFQGAGLYYAATELEARTCKGQDVVVVGGGNSAGQAAMFLAARAAHVRLICRGDDLANTMSQYLLERVRQTANVTVEMASKVIELAGDVRLRGVKIEDGGGQVAEHAVSGLFVMIGADPCTAWLKDVLQLDDRGFVLTGADCGPRRDGPLNLFQTSLPGVFAVGDVRSGSVKRVAAAVGGGSVVVPAIHARLAELREVDAEPDGRT